MIEIAHLLIERYRRNKEPKSDPVENKSKKAGNFKTSQASSLKPIYVIKPIVMTICIANPEYFK